MTTEQYFINYITNCLANLGINDEFTLVLPEDYYFSNTTLSNSLRINFKSLRGDFLYRLRGGDELLRRWIIRWEQDTGVSLFSLNIHEIIE